MNSHTLKVLEFDKIREFVRSFAASPGGKKLCDQIVPARGADTVEALLDETTEMRTEIEAGGSMPLGGVHDIRSAVAHARIGNYYLDQKALLMISDTLETADMLRKYFAGLEDARPRLCSLARGIIPLPEIAARVKKSISPKGEILDGASPDLADMRQRIKRLRVSIISTLERLVADEHIAYAFQDDFITLRNNRYVIPVRSDSRSTVPGVVHDQSQSKATFFVEPMAVVALNNELQILHKDAYYEEIRILTDITKRIARCSDEVLLSLEIVEKLDFIHARALFSRALHAVRPRIAADAGIALRQCRHPMLLARFVREEAAPGPAEAGQEDPGAGRWEFDRSVVVPVDIMKGRDTNVLIITGANAGGKTVAMKTLGLLTLMTQAGMHIPAGDESAVALFDDVFADIGDEQNIASNLSTFTAHMSRIRDIVTRVTASSLVLFDELGAGTDPAEGAALAVAILDYLRKRGCCCAVTTHLTALKTYAYGQAEVENVSVAFDPQTFKPAYRLIYGVPGISNALAMARASGIPDEIIEQAESLCAAPDRQIAQLVRGLEKAHHDLAVERKNLGKLREQAAGHHHAAAALLSSMQRRKDSVMKQFETNARHILRKYEDELMKIIKEQKKRTIIRPDSDMPSSGESRSALADVKQRLHGHFPPRAKQPAAVDHLDVGQEVHVIHLKKQGVVLSVDNQARRAEVAVGSIKVKTTFEELGQVRPENAGKEVVHKKRAEAPAAAPPPVIESRQVNVIGMRVEDALPVVDKSIDNALLGGSGSVEIIHGRGTGRLMRAIREHLAAHQSISRFEEGTAAEGGSGVTIAYIK